MYEAIVFAAAFVASLVGTVAILALITLALSGSGEPAHAAGAVSPEEAILQRAVRGDISQFEFEETLRDLSQSKVAA